jgi:CRISPR-associated protein Cmr6
LLEVIAAPDPNASFVEYLRWMREPGRAYKDPTKVQLLQMAERDADYADRLKVLTDRTRKIVGQQGLVFQAKCAWRMRVGGHRGPESILLPAFDALGIPYIPSSTLRGVARTQAIREKMAEGMDWKRADREVAEYFGHLEADVKDRSGKVIFLDAYPLPDKSGQKGGLAMDMANNIWNWKNGETPEYSPNPNSFFSLKEPTFLIGMRPASGCTNEILEQVKAWLIRGLQLGIGSQVNTGYGNLIVAGEKPPVQPFFSVEFSLEGQLIHGKQEFTSWQWNDRRNEWQMRGSPNAEVRSVAFKSILRYWFRAFALGVLPSGSEHTLENYLRAIQDGKRISPPSEVKALESLLFGSITPKTLGWVKFQIQDSDYFPTTKIDPAQQYGKIALYSNDQNLPRSDYREVLSSLFTNLTWISVRLSGLGQGARRPCYSRKSNPYWRGSSFIPDEKDPFWKNPKTVHEFKVEFQRHLNQFYTALNQLLCMEQQPRQIIDYHNPRSVLPQPTNHQWTEAIDTYCKIVVVQGESNQTKPHALEILHTLFHALEEKRKFSDAKSLCGGTKKDKIFVNSQEIKRETLPSPVIISNIAASESNSYQVITIFGATQDPRLNFLQTLKQKTPKDKFARIWPL